MYARNRKGARQRIISYVAIVLSVACHVDAALVAATTADTVEANTAGLRGSIGSGVITGQNRLGENPLIAEYRRKAANYAVAASEAEQASAAWAAKTRAAVYGSSSLTVSNTQMELSRRGMVPWARAVWQEEKMLKDPSAQKAELAAQAAAAPYEQRYKEYQSTQASYNVSANGFAMGAERDEKQATGLMGYATQSRLQGDAVAADQYVQQATMLRRQESSWRTYANKYHSTVDRIQIALPTIQRLAQNAARYASWQQNPKGAMSPKDVFPYTPAPPADPIPPTTLPPWSFASPASSMMSAMVR